MFADFDYYKETFKGKKIANADDYEYLAHEASRYISRITTEITEDTMMCECSLVEYLQAVKQQGNITSESIPNAYSVSYASGGSATKINDINSILQLYLGDKFSSVGIVTLI